MRSSPTCRSRRSARSCGVRCGSGRWSESRWRRRYHPEPRCPERHTKGRSRGRSMRRWLALALTFAIGCDVLVDPDDVPPLHGSYRLTMIDGVALPHTVKLDGEPTPVTDGILELTFPNLVAVTLTLGQPEESDLRSIAVAGPYRRVTP